MRDIPVDGCALTAFIDINQPTDSLSPLQGGFDVGLGEMPAALVSVSGAMRVNCPEPIRFLPKSGPLRAGDAALLNVDSVCIGGMVDRGYAGYEEVPFIASKPIDGSEVFIGVSFATFPPEFGEQLPGTENVHTVTSE